MKINSKDSFKSLKKLKVDKKIYNIEKKNTSFNFLSTNSKYIKKNSVLVINKKNNFKKNYD